MPLDWQRDGGDWPNRALSRFVPTRGVRWHVQRGGATGAPRVLLIHGAGGATHSWRDVIPGLLARCEVLAPDLPGQGFSAGSPARFTLPAMAEDIGALLVTEDFAPDLVVGHSAGAAIALRMVLDGRAAPRTVLSLNGALAPFRGMAGAVFPTLARLLSLNPLTGALFSRSAAAPGAVRALIGGTGSRIDPAGLRLYEQLIASPDHVTATLAMMARWKLEPLIADLPRVQVPVTLAAGLDDRAVPPQTSRDAARRLPHAELREVAGRGHLMHEEAPAEFAEMIATLAGASERAKV